jgi:DNA-binding HxlR family transcriptional regulator
VAATTSASVGVLTYHMRELESAGLIKLVATQPVRGAVEHFYELTEVGREAIRAVEAVLRLEPRRPARASRAASRRPRRTR